MVRKLRHADIKADRHVVPATMYRRGVVQAAQIQAEAIEDACRGSDPTQFTGNVADALYHIATALQRIAEAMEDSADNRHP